MRLANISLLLALTAFCGSAAGADELRGAVNKNDAASRISRPQLPPLTGKATAAAGQTAIDTDAFKIGAGTAIDPNMDPSIWRTATARQSHLMGRNSIARYALAERNWQASSLLRDTGVSNIHVQITIALCPPSSGPQRQAWETLMEELTDPAMAPAWKQWQDMLTNAVLEKRFFGPRLNGAMATHVRILRNGTSQVHGPQGSPFAEAVQAEIRAVGSEGRFAMPLQSQTTEVHALVIVREH